MRLAGLLRQLARDLGSQKLRTVLTTLGIVWGTVAVSLLLAFGEGFHQQLRRNSAGLGGPIVIAWPSRTSMPYQGLGKGRRIRLDEDDVELLKKRAVELGSLSSEYNRNLTLKLGPKTMSVNVSGVHPVYGEMRNMIPKIGGRFVDPIDVRLKRRVAFLGDELAEQLFGSSDPVGQMFRLHGSPFTVVGVLQTKVQDSAYSGRDKDKVLIPVSTMRSITGQKYMNNLLFTSRNVARTDEATDEIRTILAGRHRFSPEDREALSIWDTSQGAQFLDTFMIAFRLFLGIIGSLTLVVGGIGVSNIMNVVVEERTREIGIKAALGAKPRFILGQFLLETAVITGVGGAIGLLVSVGICAAFPSFGLSPYIGNPIVSPGVAGTTAALLGTIGLVAGFFPARTASRLDPVVAMKV